MPGVNTTGKPQTSDLYLGRGSIELGEIDATTGKPYHFRHVGNATAFSMNLETEKLEHQSSRSGVRSIDREIILSQKIGISLTMDEATNFDNLALFLSGSAATGVANASATAVLTDELQASNIVKGRSYDLVDDSGNRMYDIDTDAWTAVGAGLEATAVAATSPNLVLGTDYEIDYKWGTIFILSTAPNVAASGDNLYLTYDEGDGSTPQTLDTVTMLTTSKVSAFLRFKAINPANSDSEMLVDLHSVSLSADGDLPLIGEEFAELTVTGVAERNETGYPTAPVGRIYYHGDA